MASSRRESLGANTSVTSSTLLTTYTTTTTRISRASGVDSSLLQYGVGDKLALVLEIGSAYTRCGFASESTPRCIVPSTTLHKEKTVNVYDPQSLSSVAELKEILIDFLSDLFYNHVGTKAHQRRVVVCEDIACSTNFREALVNVLFTQFQVFSVALCPAHLMALLSMGATTGIVVDVGNFETRVCAVYEGVPMAVSYTCVPVAAEAYNRSLEDMIRKQGRVFVGPVLKPFLSVRGSLPRHTLEDIAVKLCFACGPAAPGQGQKAPQAATVTYSLSPSELLQVDHSVRVGSADILFRGDHEGASVPGAILDCLLACPRDSRKELAGGLCVVGGLSMLRGFGHRLLTELRMATNRPEYAELSDMLSLQNVCRVELQQAQGTPTEESIAQDALKITELVAAELHINVGTMRGREFAVEGGKAILTWTTPLDYPVATLVGLKTVLNQTYLVTSATSTHQQLKSGVQSSFAMFDSIFPQHFATWAGGSVFGALDIVGEKSITREQYTANPQISDWCTLKAAPERADGSSMPLRTFSQPPADRPKEWGLGAIAFHTAVSLVP